MPCPYAERRGALVYCRAIGKNVNPLAFPCLTERYERCRYYREAIARERAKAEETPASQRPTVAKPSTGRPTGETRGITPDGKRARSCLECVFYSEATGTCLLLGVKVEDPRDPPCAKG